MSRSRVAPNASKSAITMKTCAGVVAVAECRLGLASSVSLAVSRWFYEKWFSAMLFERLAPRGHFDSAVRVTYAHNGDVRRDSERR